MNTQKEKHFLNELSFCVFDLETTGGNHQSDKIIEIGLVKVENLKIKEKKNYLIRPEITIPAFIQKLTSISTEDVEGAPLIEDVIDEILNFMGDSILVAHNTSFDIPFFNSVLERLGKDKLKNKDLCTNLMTKYLIPSMMTSNLTSMCKIFGIKHKNAHRALDDAIGTAKLLIHYLQIFKVKGISKTNHLYYPQNRFELDRCKITPDWKISDITQKLKNVKSSALVSIKGENGSILFSLPYRGGIDEEEIKLILERIEKQNWKLLTIQLYGAFLESLIHFSSLFNKLSVPNKNEAINFLNTKHLKLDGPEVTLEMISSKYGDFIFSNHLVPEQHVIFPTGSLTSKSNLILRYPSHQKKMMQFIGSKKLSHSKSKTHHSPMLEKFIYKYLLEEKSLLFFKSSEVAKSERLFLKLINKFLANNPNSYQYPKEYI